LIPDGHRGSGLGQEQLPAPTSLPLQRKRLFFPQWLLLGADRVSGTPRLAHQFQGLLVWRLNFFSRLTLQDQGAADVFGSGC
jgi:hypothetical protein